MAISFVLFAVNIYFASCGTTPSTIESPITLGYKPSRPSYAGTTGGNWVGDSEQRIPPGKPWPSKPENYSHSNVPVTAVTLNEEIIVPSKLPATNSPPFEPSASQSVPPDEPWPTSLENIENFNGTWQKPLLESEANQASTIFSAIGQSTSSPENEILTTSKLPESNRPQFLGSTGGNFIPERVPPGKPLPARPGDYEGFSVTSQKPVSLINELSTTLSLVIPPIEVITSPKPLISNRPPFLGSTEGNYIPEEVPPGKPLPAEPEDYEGFNVTSQIPTSQTSKISTTPSVFHQGIPSEILKPENEVVTLLKLPVPNRPPFLGPTGGNYIPQRVPPGKPWPARPEDYESFSVTSQKPIPAPNRPPFLGPTGGNFIPERVPPGKPWPAKPEDYEGFSVTSKKPISQTHEEGTTSSEVDQGTLKPENEVVTPPKLPVPNRPPFAGPTGGNYIPERVPPGKPWPARPEDYESFSVTSQKPIPAPNRPPFLGPTGGNFIPERVPPGKPWPARPEDYEGFSVTSQKPLSQTTELRTTSSAVDQDTLKPENEVATPPEFPVPNRPPLLGPTGGNYIPERVPPGKPWPAKPEDYESSSVASQNPTPAPSRPSFLGPTGGNFIPERVPPGKPWPARPEDYESSSVTSQKPISETSEVSTTSSEVDQGTLKPENEVVTPPKLPVPNRPPFAGPTGGNYIPERVPPGKPWPAKPEDYESSSVASQNPTPAPSRPSFLGPTGGNFIPERVPPGKPWPARPEDYEGFGVTSQKPISQTPEVNTSSEVDQSNLKPEHEVATTPKLPVSNKPPFLGPTGGNYIPERVPPGKPWPARPEDNESSSVASQNPTPAPSRPSFLGPTGGNFIPERVPPGKPWPARPEDYEGFGVTSQKPISQTPEVSTTSSEVDKDTLKPEDEVVTTPKLPIPNKPPFLGPTGGNYIPERVSPGKPWPARPENNENSSVASHQPTPAPSRPTFLGPTGGNFIPERVPPGKPWPARPEDYEGFGVTSQKPISQNPEVSTASSGVDQTLKPEDEVVTTPKVPVPNKPPFLGPPGGNYIPERVPPRKPFPARPEDNESSSVASQKPTPAPSRPTFLGPTGGNFIPERVPPGKPWPARPEDYEGFGVTSQKPISQTPEVNTSSEIDQSNLKPEHEVATTPKLPVSNKPPFLGPTGGNYIPERVPPGKPWPARPEDYENFNNTSQKPELLDEINKTTTVSLVSDKDTLKPQNEVITSPKPLLPSRPPFLGPTGGNFIPEKVPPGKPWPAKPEDYEGFNITSQKPSIAETSSNNCYLKPQDVSNTSSEVPIANSPPFLGSGEGDKKPTKPEDYEGFHISSQESYTEDVQDASIHFPEDRKSNDYKNPLMTSVSPQPLNISPAYFHLDLGEANSATKNGFINKLKLPAQQQLASEDSTKKPSLAISFNIDALKTVGGSSTTRGEGSSPIEDTKQFLSAEKVNNIGQNKKFLTVSIKLGDFISSAKNLSAARFSVSQVSKTSHTSDTGSGEIEPQVLSENQSHVNQEQGSFNHVLKKPLLSVFVNLKDFRKTNKYPLMMIKKKVK